ncbi:MarR family transcriptional regulator [Sphaerisporangium album]|uniref:MarR family transcriptional regulator n=2 Tax=Sphaerisporangium album TaxID=509200 RepID=A0A367FC06_9ACTN|nr:MarR family transcriptional regulator [Sphaerisporangium album]
MRTMVLDLYDRRKEVCAALDMSFIRAKALRHLAAAPMTEPMTMRRLAAELVTDAPYTTVVVDDLVRRGLVVRDVHPDDRRQKIVTVTAEGAKAAALAESILTEPPPPLRTLDPADLAALHRILTALARR